MNAAGAVHERGHASCPQRDAGEGEGGAGDLLVMVKVLASERAQRHQRRPGGLEVLIDVLKLPDD